MRTPATVFGPPLASCLLALAFSASCSSDTSLKSGSGKAQPAAKTQPASGSSQPPAKSTSSADGQPAGTSAPGTTSGSGSSSGASNISSDTNEKIIPPDVVGGAYLTCGPVQSQAQPAADGSGYYGCATYQDSGARLPVKNTKVRVAITDMNGQPLADAQVVKLTDVDADIVWQAPMQELLAGVSGQIAVADAQGAYHPIPKRIIFTDCSSGICQTGGKD